LVPVDAVIVFPERGNLFYQTLANRIAAASLECGVEAVLRPAGDLGDIEGRLGLIVNPSECALSGEPFLQRVGRFGTSVAVLAESVETQWYEAQHALGIALDAILDVGFVEQTPASGPPYRFVFNGPTRSESAAIESQAPTQRPIPWLLVAHRTDERVALAAQLVTEVAPTGVVFLPRSKRVRAGGGTLDPTAVEQLLRQSSIYVWESHHRHRYFESFRFVDGLVAGAAPAKLDTVHPGSFEIPNVFASVAALAAETPQELHRTARDWYLAQPTLAEALGPTLAAVVA
jgi:hypothetical protein